jgi:hypothetical protein
LEVQLAKMVEHHEVTDDVRLEDLAQALPVFSMEDWPQD